MKFSFKGAAKGVGTALVVSGALNGMFNAGGRYERDKSFPGAVFFGVTGDNVLDLRDGVEAFGNGISGLINLVSGDSKGDNNTGQGLPRPEEMVVYTSVPAAAIIEFSGVEL